MRRTAVAALALVAVAASLLAPGATASETARRGALDVTGWRHATAAGLPTPDAGDGAGPGSYLLVEHTDDSVLICTANFLWTDGATTYLGAAGHCFLPSDPVTGESLDDVEVGSSRWVRRVQVCVSACFFGGQLGGAFTGELRDLGQVVYARQHLDGDDVGHDFGIVEVPPSVAPLVRAAVPVWGGPSGAGSIGGQACLYGNAIVLGEVFATKARTGLGLGQDGGAWFAALPSLPGDSGSAVVNCPGLTGTTAVGILTHLTGSGVAGTTVARAVEMVQTDLGRTISLVTA